MSVSKWRYTEECNGRPCPGDCDHCSFEPADLISRADEIEAKPEYRNEDMWDKEKSTYNKGWNDCNDAWVAIIKALPSADAEPKMTEEVREALMRLTMCAREECGMCKYKYECDFDFQYKISTDNMNTLLDALSAEAVQGEWIKTEHCSNENGFKRWIELECPFCGHSPFYGHFDDMNFCPNCGARMEDTK